MRLLGFALRLLESFMDSLAFLFEACAWGRRR